MAFMVLPAPLIQCLRIVLQACNTLLAECMTLLRVTAEVCVRVILHSVGNFVDEHLEQCRTLRYSDIRIYKYTEKSGIQTTRLARSQCSLANYERAKQRAL